MSIKRKEPVKKPVLTLVRVMGEVASASGGRKSEQNEAPRSTSEIRQYRVVGHRKSERTEGSSPKSI
jgi:hypothetical protein